MTKLSQLILGTAGVIAAGAVQVNAILVLPTGYTPIVLYNTGVTAPNNPDGTNSNIQTTGGAADPNYTVVASPQVATPTPALVVTDQGAYYRPGNSQYINDTGSGGNNEAVGNYDYQTTFTIPAGYTPGAQARLAGTIYVDNSIADVLLNGVSTGISGGSFGNGSQISFVIPFGTAAFQTGTNTLDFIVNNAGGTPNPTALDVTYLRGVVPEPASLSLLGLGGLGLLARRRKA